ncbi:hypothetical protein OG788_45605 [Streptomyces sp. NBC_00647]|uniref:hypothetical protein n=1 Tax=Streptomyces sp. NBC_00647 TaxID=2975796 RepID=UPI003253E25C
MDAGDSRAVGYQRAFSDFVAIKLYDEELGVDDEIGSQVISSDEPDSARGRPTSRGTKAPARAHGRGHSSPEMRFTPGLKAGALSQDQR